MKLKRRPEDFQVEELPIVTAGDRGRYTFYRLTKRGLGTLEVIEAIRRRWNIPAARIAYGGLKDRHAATIQYLTIADGPRQPLHQSSFAIEPLGLLPHEYGPHHFRGNRFRIVVRDLSAAAALRAVRAAESIARDGLPNYFDDQRFGSVGFAGAFAAEAWLKGEYERAFQLAVADPNPSDRPDSQAEKAILRECWGNWAAAKARLGRSHARSLVTYLADHPVDFRGAFARIRRELRSLIFSAYQSHLWNLLLARTLERITRPDQRVPIEFKTATMPLHHDLDPDQAQSLAALAIPLPSVRTPLPEGPMRDLALSLVAERGLEWGDLRVKHLRDVFFSKGTRPALFFPTNLKSSTVDDELYPGRQAVLLAFELPKGAYATLLVKRVTEAS